MYSNIRIIYIVIFNRINFVDIYYGKNYFNPIYVTCTFCILFKAYFLYLYKLYSIFKVNCIVYLIHLITQNACVTPYSILNERN